MSGSATKASLSPARRRLLELMQKVNFGRIEGLAVRGGEPVFDPPPRVFREVKFRGENGPRRELHAGDFLLKSEVVGLLEELTRLRDGTVESIRIKHGVPFHLSVEETTRT